MDIRAQQVVILEDDVNFALDFTKRWSASMSELNKQQWSLFYPGHALKELPSGISRLSPETEVLCAHFFVVNGRAIAPMVRGLELILSRPAGHPSGGPMHVDGAYSTVRAQNPSLTTYACFPVLGYQRPSRSDISKEKWFDRIGAFAPIVNIGRRLSSFRSPD